MGIGQYDEVEVGDNAKELVVLYRHMIEAYRKCADLKAGGKDYANEKMRMQKIEIKVNALWPQLSNNEQKGCCSQLIISGYMDCRIGELMIMFGSTVSVNEPEEPCLRLKL